MKSENFSESVPTWSRFSLNMAHIHKILRTQRATFGKGKKLFVVVVIIEEKVYRRIELWRKSNYYGTQMRGKDAWKRAHSLQLNWIQHNSIQ